MSTLPPAGPFTLPSTPQPTQPPEPAPTPQNPPQGFTVSPTIAEQSVPELLAQIAYMAMEFGLQVEVIRPVKMFSVALSPGTVYDTSFVTGLVTIQQKWGPWIVMASVFFPSLVNDPIKSMERYQRGR